jgi:deazaflavin-dependent oxidoreductase (nitroreductase family)
MRVLLRILVGLVTVAVAGAAAVVLGIRAKYPPVLNAVRRTLRDRGNPGQLRTAGAPGQAHGVIEHVGRTSGRAYRTPVTPVATAEGFVVAMPYGPTTDWVRNVLAAGTATLVLDGETIPVDRPEVRPLADVRDALSPGSRLAVRLFGVRTCLVLHRGSS